MLLKKLALSVAVLGGALLVTWAAIAALVPGEDQSPGHRRAAGRRSPQRIHPAR